MFRECKLNRWLLLVVVVILYAPFDARGAATEEGFGTEEVKQQEPVLADEVQALWVDADLDLPEKVKRFRVITEQHWLAFVGFVHVHAERSYLDIFHWHKKQYLEAMQSLDSDTDVSELLVMAKENLGKDALVSADALMLAAILNWEAAQPTLIELSDPNVAKDAHVRPIHVHTLCLIAAAKQSDAMIEKLQPILRLTQHEEMREDILCAISAFDNKQAADWIRGYIEANLNGEFDEAMSTALLIMRVRSNPDAFKTYMKHLIDTTENSENAKLLATYMEDPSQLGVMEPPPNGSQWFYKLWDNFHATSTNDGTLMKYGDRLEHFVKD